METMTPKDIHILLVEDDEVDIMNVKRSFKKNDINYTLHVAHDGIEALEMLKGSDTVTAIPRPRVILLDINMPRMGGIEFLGALRADNSLKSISVFVMTTSNSDADIIDAYNLNVAGYILKPLSVDNFHESVKKLKGYWEIIELP